MIDKVFDVGGAADNLKPRWAPLYVRVALRGLLVGAAYYFGSLLGYALIFPSSYISIMWPPNAVLLVALLLSPGWQWPWLLLIPLPFHILAQSQFGASLTAASLYYAFNCCIVPLTAVVLRWVGVGDLALSDLRRALVFIAGTTIAVSVGTLIWSPLIVSLWIGGDLWESWTLVFLSNYLPFLIATPGLVIGLCRGADIIKSTSLARSTEFALLALGLLACAIGVFGLAQQAIENVPALFYTPLPFLLWAAVRFGPGGLSFAFLIFALMAMFDAVAGYGPFVTRSAGDSVLRLQAFLLALYIPLLVLASVVAERRSKEEALRESEARYRAVVEDQTELICRFLPDGTITFVNGAYCRYFQLSPEELIGRTFWALIPPEGHQAAREFLASITPDHPVATREHEVLTSDGTLRWQQWRDRGFFDEHGRVTEYQAVGRDITERKQAEETRRELAHAARLAMVGELTASIAHEINQPLNAIMNNADAAEILLESSPAPLDEVRQILVDIRRDDLRASDVIRRLRALLRKREMEVQPVDLNELIQEVLKLVRSEAERRGVAVEAVLAANLPLVLGDKVHLQQVLLNLLLNGMEAMADTPGTRHIILRNAVNENGSVEIAVSDTGPGITTDQLSRLFDPFFSTKKEGMGLGLSIARSLVEAHGGSIWAENNSEGGATFRFTVPTTAKQPTRESSETQKAALEVNS
jgi:PAS domain S-box-containing protein